MTDEKNPNMKLAQGENIIASSSKGKEVIKVEVSQELEKVKQTFENLQISEISKQEITNKLKKTVKGMWEKRGVSVTMTMDFTQALVERIKKKRTD